MRMERAVIPLVCLSRVRRMLMRKLLLILFLATVLLYVVAAGWSMHAYEERKAIELVRYPPDVRPFADFGPYVSSRQGGFMIVSGAMLGTAWLTAVVVPDRCRAKKAGKQKNQNKSARARLGSVLMQLEMNGSVGGEKSFNRKLASGTVATLLLIGMLTLGFNIQSVRASETTYIRADGSVNPDTAPILSVDNITYIFTDDIYDSVVVERDNIVVDGSGYTVQGRRISWSKGIDLTGRENVTVRNTQIKNFHCGIWLSASYDNSISGNTITSNDAVGIELDHSTNNSIRGNTITSTDVFGIELSASHDNSISGNNVANNSYGIWLSASYDNSISGNTITSNDAVGITLSNSTNNSIRGNTIAANNLYGIELDHSTNNSIRGNNVANNDAAGIELSASHDNSIRGNNVTNNDVGIWFYHSSNNAIYHNNFIDNGKQVNSHASTNVWDDGYPSGGNYWSDYATRYPVAQEIDDSGIWDTLYNQDNYPLMNPWSTGWSPERPVEKVKPKEASDKSDNVIVYAYLLFLIFVGLVILGFWWGIRRRVEPRRRRFGRGEFGEHMETDIRLTYKRFKELYPHSQITYAEYKKLQVEKAFKRAISSEKIKRMVR